MAQSAFPKESGTSRWVSKFRPAGTMTVFAGSSWLPCPVARLATKAVSASEMPQSMANPSGQPNPPQHRFPGRVNQAAALHGKRSINQINATIPEHARIEESPDWWGGRHF
jgi:hypothetical protein